MRKIGRTTPRRRPSPLRRTRTRRCFRKILSRRVATASALAFGGWQGGLWERIVKTERLNLRAAASMKKVEISEQGKKR